LTTFIEDAGLHYTPLKHLDLHWIHTCDSCVRLGVLSVN